MFITYAEKTHPRYHRKHWLIRNGLWLFAEFDTEDQLKLFADTLGFTYTLTKTQQEHPIFGEARFYELDTEIVQSVLFWKLEELPENAKPIWALSNGSVVECYYAHVDGKIRIYRPNPNAKDVYKPLSPMEQIGHQLRYGIY